MKDYNQAVLEEARKYIGKVAGKGQCTDLAAEALRKAGASSLNQVMDPKDITDTADYSWGTPASQSDIRPGDIIQFQDFNLAYLKETVTKMANQTITYTYTETQQRGHHTAMLDSINNDGSLVILEQHLQGVHGTVKNTIYLESKTYDHVQFRKQKPPINLDGVTVTVSGTLHFYHPMEPKSDSTPKPPPLTRNKPNTQARHR